MQLSDTIAPEDVGTAIADVRSVADALGLKNAGTIFVASPADGRRREVSDEFDQAQRSGQETLNGGIVEWWNPDDDLPGIRDMANLGSTEWITDRSGEVLVPNDLFDSALDDASFFSLLGHLLGSGDRVMAPGSNSALWRMYLDGLYLRNQQIVGELSSIALRRVSRARPATADIRAIAWILVHCGLIAARLGEARRAVGLFGLAERIRVADLELTAWIWNGRSIAYGKLEDNQRYQSSTRRAVELGNRAGLYWLSASVQLRHLHKLSWAAAEDGALLPNAQFNSAIQRVVSGSAVDRVDATHLGAQVDAYLALQYTWQPAAWDLAEQHIISAQTSFLALGDVSEFTRMASERGRLYLLSGYGAKAVRTLQDGLRRRLLGGEFPRARYDLIWLGDAFVTINMDTEAEACYLLSLSLHEQLYGIRDVDKAVVRQAVASLSAGSHSLRDSGRRKRLDLEFLRHHVVDATQLTAVEIGDLIDLDRLRQTIVRYAK